MEGKEERSRIMDLFWIIVSDILQLTAGYYFYKIECAFLQPKKGKAVFLFAWIGISAAATIAVFPRDPVNITVGLLFLTAVNFFLFEGKWFVKLSALTVLYPMAMSLNYLHLDVGVKLWHLLQPDRPEYMGDPYAAASYGLVVLFWYLFYRLLRDSLVRIHQILTAKAWMTVNVICLASFVAVFSCTFFAPEPTYVMWPCLIACIITNIGSIRLAASYLAEGIYADMERKNLQLQQNYYRELENN